MAEWQTEWSNGGNGRNGGMAYGMAERRNGGMVEWREWLLEWREWLPTYYFMVHTNACVGIVQCIYFAVLHMVQKLLGGQHTYPPF
jgi:hypothetical protein